MKKLGEVVVSRLLMFMEEKKLSQYKLAMLSGVPYPTLKSIMQRRTKSIDLKTIILLASGLGITPSELIDDDGFLAENLDFD